MFLPYGLALEEYAEGDSFAASVFSTDPLLLPRYSRGSTRYSKGNTRHLHTLREKVSFSIVEPSIYN